MERYDKESECVKCGESGATSKWRGARESSYLGIDRGGDIERTCLNCGYIWYERPLDELISEAF